MSPLKRSPRSNRFCGPAAVALLAGCHVDHAAAVLRAASGKRAIKGVAPRHIMAALAAMGYWALPVPAVGRPTLIQAQGWGGVLRDREKGARYLVMLTGHWVVIEGRKLFDNRHPAGVSLILGPYPRKHIRGVWQVVPAPQAKFEVGVKHA